MKRNKDGTFVKGVHSSKATEFKKGHTFWLGKTGEKASNWRGGKPKCIDCNKQLKTHGAKQCKSCFYKSRRKTMGLSGKPFYHIWVALRNRCENPKNQAYKDYGGRGIKLCNRWQIFENFYNDMYATYKKGLQIDRIDNNRGYEPENCKWVTSKEQQNNRRNNLFIEFYGIRDTLANWANFFNINYYTLYNRIYVKKWSLEKSFWYEPN